MRRRLGKRGTIVALTVVWLVDIPALFFFFTRVIGWPRDYTLLTLGSIFLFFVPGGYALAIAAAERRDSGIGIVLSSTFIWRCSVVSLPLALFSLCGLWFYGMLKSDAYWWMAVAGLVAAVSAWGTAAAFRRVIALVRGNGQERADTSAGRE